MKLTDLTDKQSLEALPKKIVNDEPYECDYDLALDRGCNRTIDQYNQLEFGGDVKTFAKYLWIEEKCLYNDSPFHYMSQEQLDQIWEHVKPENKAMYERFAKGIINSMPQWLTVRKGA